jgi:hypothetical protein
MVETLDERCRMATASHDVKAPKREHPLIVTGLIMAVLLAALVALPFVSRLMHAPISPVSVTPANGVTPSTPAASRVRDF